MTKLVLIKHSLPEIQPDLPARRWRLSEEGRRRCRPLADRLVAHVPERIFTSREPKAMETAALVGSRLGLPVEPRDGLHEHDRETVPYKEE